MSQSKDESKLGVRYGGDLLNNLTPKDFVANSLMYLLDPMTIKYAPLDGLRGLFKECMEVSLEYCTEVYQSPHLISVMGIHRAGITSLRKKLYHLIEFSDFYPREALLKAYYDTLLFLEGLGPLRNFGVGNVWGDKLVGDPEKASIRNVHTLMRKE